MKALASKEVCSLIKKMYNKNIMLIPVPILVGLIPLAWARVIIYAALMVVSVIAYYDRDGFGKRFLLEQKRNSRMGLFFFAFLSVFGFLYNLVLVL